MAINFGGGNPALGVAYLILPNGQRFAVNDIRVKLTQSTQDLTMFGDSFSVSQKVGPVYVAFEGNGVEAPIGAEAPVVETKIEPFGKRRIRLEDE
jgi:hypothetical protein